MTSTETPNETPTKIPGLPVGPIEITSQTPLNSLRDLCHEVAVSKGWWPEDRDLDEILMLFVSEVSEATEEVRRPDFQANAVHIENEKPEGFGIELADVAIRVLDYAGWKGIDLEGVACEGNCYGRHHHISNLAHLTASARRMIPYRDKIMSQLYQMIKTVVLVGEGNRRLLDILLEVAACAERNRIDFLDAIRIKLQYNQTRPQRHGGKRA